MPWPSLSHPSFRSVLPILLAISCLVTGGCQGCRSDSRPDGVSGDQGLAIALREHPLAELDIPPDSRPHHEEPPTQIPVTGPWRYLGTSRQGAHKYATTIPIRPRSLFFYRPKPGLTLQRDGKVVEYSHGGAAEKDPTWSHDRTKLIVQQPEREPPPDTGYYLVYDRATERERALNFQFSGIEDPGAFVWKQIQDDWDAREGMLLPAPGRAAWDVAVPPAAELHFVGGLVEPEILEGQGSDGATLTVEVEVEGTVTPIYSTPLAVRNFEGHRVDLSAYAGQTVRLRLSTEPGETPDYDYAFIAEPVLASRLENPVRIIMVFVDTLRPDHMSLYGYARDTTESLDRFSEHAAVFTQARSVAPWTLPSARAIVTGRHPELYEVSETLPSVLGKQGWATAFIAGNVYLSVNFAMAKDWSFHRVGLWPPANEVTDDALAWLDRTEGRNGLIQVHYMDPHLPYQEPRSYRRRYAGDSPDGLREAFHLRDVRRNPVTKTPEARAYIQDRYDNNIRYTFDQVARILERTDDNDIVVVYADHGEEFWDHDGFEHGHSLFDELLRVPLVVRAPGLPSGRFDVPVSLLDITPTLLDLTGQPVGKRDGQSLVPLIRGDANATEGFRNRSQAFGRPLYGQDRWGVLNGPQKWTTHAGQEALFDLDADPGEATDLFGRRPGNRGAPFRKYLADALQRPVPDAYRLVPSTARGKPVNGTWMLCTIPGGFDAAFTGGDPLSKGAATVLRHIDGAADLARRQLETYQVRGHTVPNEPGAVVEACWHPGQGGIREVYLVPTAGMAQEGLMCSFYQGDAGGGQWADIRFGGSGAAPKAGVRAALSRTKLPQRRFTLTYGFAPVPNERTQQLDATDDEQRDALVEMGYLEPDTDEPEDVPDPTPVPGGSESEAAGLTPCPPPTSASTPR